MKLSRSHLLYIQSKYLADLLAILIAFGVTSFWRYREIYNPSTQHLFGVFLVFLSSWYISSFFSDLYLDRRTKKFSEEIIVTFYNNFISVLLSSSALFFFVPATEYSKTFLVSFFIFTPVFTIVFKYIIRKYTHHLIYKGELTEKFILVGYTSSGADFLDMVERFKYYGYTCTGILDDQNVNRLGIPYLGRINELESILEQKPAQEVILALSNAEASLVKNIIQLCDRAGRKIRLMPDLEKYTNANIEVANLGIMPVLNYKKLPLDRWESRLLKRIFDLIFSIFFFLLIGIWLFPILAILIKMTSKGPILFRQERWGLANEPILCYKFRTMSYNSKDLDENGNYTQATQDDPRITKLGRFLRKTSLDELPQFWNVLIGNMSVVGPRPHPVPLNMESIETVDNYMLRHIVKPGISGWAQVNGYRGETKTKDDMQKRVDHDLYYINRWNIFFDIQIILQTIINIFRGDQNAY